MNRHWYANFEALRTGQMTQEEWQEFSRRPRRVTRGLPEHGIAERQAMQEEFSRLQLACRLFLQETKDFEALLARQATFGDDYRLLKTLAVSAINLLDFPAPSVPLLEMDEEFAVEVRQGTFQVVK